MTVRGYKLEPLQSLTLKILAKSKLKDKFYWTGGTALAFFYLKHRHSHDVDLFSDLPFTYNEILPLISELKLHTKLKKVDEKRIFDRWEFFIHNKNELKLEFCHYNFPSLGGKNIWQGISVDSLKDMAANKTMALLDRHEPKDAFDVYFLIKKSFFSPRDLLKMVKKKFGVKFSLSTLLSQGLLGASRLHEIRPLLHCSKAKQNQIIEETIEYFESESVKFLRKKFKLE